MDALILLAHGSRNPRVAREVADLAAQIKGALPAHRVGYAFLELTSPSLQEVVAELARNGADVVRVLPLFLNTGDHVERDIPQLLAAVRRDHPRLDMRLLPHIGAHPEYVSLIEAAARDALQSNSAA